jgi:hypothetical protein
MSTWPGDEAAQYRTNPDEQLPALATATVARGSFLAGSQPLPRFTLAFLPSSFR